MLFADAHTLMLTTSQTRPWKPTVSVLMPVFNTHPTILKESIESVLTQSFRDFEFLIFNDGSTDPQVEHVVKSFNDPRIRYFCSKENMGISGARNQLLAEAQGDFLAIMDHDDLALPSRLEKQVEFLKNHADIGVCGAQVERFPKKKILHFPKSDAEIREEMFFSCPLQHSVVMLRKSALGDIRYEADFSPAEDYALFACLFGRTKFANLPDVLLRYRLFNANTTHSRKRLMSANAARVRERLRTEFPARWDTVRRLYAKNYRFELFSFIPLLTVRRELTKFRFYLFGKIFFLTIRMTHTKLKERNR